MFWVRSVCRPFGVGEDGVGDGAVMDILLQTASDLSVWPVQSQNK